MPGKDRAQPAFLFQAGKALIAIEGEVTPALIVALVGETEV